MLEDIDKILEIKPKIKTEIQDKSSPRTSPVAKASFKAGVSIIPIATLSIIMGKTIIYNPPLEAINGMLYIVVYLILLPVAVLSGIVALIQIARSKKVLSGYGFAILGIALSVISSILYGFITIGIALEGAFH